MNFAFWYSEVAIRMDGKYTPEAAVTTGPPPGSRSCTRRRVTVLYGKNFYGSVVHGAQSNLPQVHFHIRRNT